MPRPAQARVAVAGRVGQPPLHGAARRGRPARRRAFERAVAGGGQVVRQIDGERLRDGRPVGGDEVALEGQRAARADPRFFVGPRNLVAPRRRGVDRPRDDDAERPAGMVARVGSRHADHGPELGDGDVPLVPVRVGRAGRQLGQNVVVVGERDEPAAGVNHVDVRPAAQRPRRERRRQVAAVEVRHARADVDAAPPRRAVGPGGVRVFRAEDEEDVTGARVAGDDATIRIVLRRVQGFDGPGADVNPVDPRAVEGVAGRVAAGVVHEPLAARRPDVGVREDAAGTGVRPAGGDQAARREPAHGLPASWRYRTILRALPVSAGSAHSSATIGRFLASRETSSAPLRRGLVAVAWSFSPSSRTAQR